MHSPGRACAGLLALVSRYVQLVGCAVVVGVAYSWLVALGVLGTALVFRHGQRGGLRRYSQVFGPLAPAIRRSGYLRRVATAPAAGKEIRVFGLVGWLRERHREAYLALADADLGRPAAHLPQAVPAVLGRRPGHRGGGVRGAGRLGRPR